MNLYCNFQYLYYVLYEYNLIFIANSPGGNDMSNAGCVDRVMQDYRQLVIAVAERFPAAQILVSLMPRNVK